MHRFKPLAIIMTYLAFPAIFCTQGCPQVALAGGRHLSTKAHGHDFRKGELLILWICLLIGNLASFHLQDPEFFPPSRKIALHQVFLAILNQPDKWHLGCCDSPSINLLDAVLYTFIFVSYTSCFLWCTLHVEVESSDYEYRLALGNGQRHQRAGCFLHDGFLPKKTRFVYLDPPLSPALRYLAISSKLSNCSIPVTNHPFPGCENVIQLYKYN